MLLNRIIARARLARTSGGDAGAALATVVGVAVMFALLGAVLVATAVFASSVAVRGGAVGQAQAAADSAIDARLADLNGALGTDFKDIDDWCTPETTTISTPNGTAVLSTEVMFRINVSGATVEKCDIGEHDEVVGATITANGSTTGAAIDGTDTFNRSWVADFVYTERDGSLSDDSDPSMFDHALWSNSDFKVTNNMKVVGGTFTNKLFDCTVKARIDGPVTAIGSGRFTNNCEVTGQLHLGKSFQCTSNAKFGGPVLIAGGDVNQITNGCHFSSEFRTNSRQVELTSAPVFEGNVTLTGRQWAGDAMAPDRSNVIDNTGFLRVSNTPRFDEHVTAVSVARTEGTPFSGLIKPGKALVTGASARTEPVVQPTSQTMEIVHESTVRDQAAFSTPDTEVYESWKDFLSAKTGKTITNCTAGPWNIPGGKIVVSVPTLVVEKSCDPVLQDVTVELKASLAIVTHKGFRFTNSVHITKGAGAENIRFWVTVPLPEGITTTCSSFGNRDINYAGGAMTIDPAIRVLLYTNGKVTLSNPVKLTGAIYACNQGLENDQEIYYKDPGFYEPDGQFCYNTEGDRWKPAPDTDEPCADTKVKYFDETRRFAVAGVS